MSDCLKLSVAQKDALVAQGWTVLGGPYTNQDECLVGCGSTTTTGEPSTTTTGGTTTSTGEPSTTTTLPVRYICIDGICTETYEVGPGTFSTLEQCQANCGGGSSTTSTQEPSTTTSQGSTTTTQEPTTTTTPEPVCEWTHTWGGPSPTLPMQRVTYRWSLPDLLKVTYDHFRYDDYGTPYTHWSIWKGYDATDTLVAQGSHQFTTGGPGGTSYWNPSIPTDLGIVYLKVNGGNSWGVLTKNCNDPTTTTTTQEPSTTTSQGSTTSTQEPSTTTSQGSTTSTQEPSTSTSQGSTTTTQEPSTTTTPGFVAGYYCCRMDDVPNSWDCRHLNNSSGLVLGSGPYATLEECQAQSLCGGGTTTTSDPSTTTTGGSTTSTQEPSTTTTLAPCPACTQNPPPQTWDFTVAGLTGNCAQLNGDYTLNYVGECEWRTGSITFTNGECTDNNAYFKMTWDGNLFKWIIAFHSTCFTDLLDWYSSTGYDCCEAKLFVGHNYGCSGVQDFVAVSACTPPTTTTTQPGSTTTQPGSTTTTQAGCSGPHTTACCPGGLPDTLVLHAGTDSYTLTWDGWGSWTTGQDWPCPMPVSLTCPYDAVVLSPFGISPVSGSCATGWNFGNVDFSGVGCSFSPSTRATTVSCGGGGVPTTTTGQGSSSTSQGSSSSGEGSSSSSAPGTIATNCCPSHLLPATLHSNLGDFVWSNEMLVWYNVTYDQYLWCDSYSNNWMMYSGPSFNYWFPSTTPSCNPFSLTFDTMYEAYSGQVTITG